MTPHRPPSRKRTEDSGQVAWSAPRGEESSLYREPLSDAAWREALRRARLGMRDRDQTVLASIVARIDDAIGWLDPVMTRYCEQTCPTCEDPCCRGKRIFFNLADVLVLAARNDWIPPGQTRSMDGEPCRYLVQTGCTLKRAYRPYVCVWFLCEPQMELLAQESVKFQRAFLKAMEAVRAGRLALERLCGDGNPWGVSGGTMGMNRENT